MPLFSAKKRPNKNTRPVQTKRVVHPARVIRPTAGTEQAASEGSRQAETSPIAAEEATPEVKDTPKPNPAAKKFSAILESIKKTGASTLPRKYRVRTAIWDFGSILSLVMNAVLIGVVIVLAGRLKSLETSLENLLGGLYDNFGRMDRSSIMTTIQMEDVPIPMDFSLPIVQEETNVTLTRAVTMRNAHITIDSGGISIDSVATVTLPAGTILPVSMQMDVPVQTTVMMDMQIPVNIPLASAIFSDPSIADLHSALLGLQDAIGPLYCMVQPLAVDFLAQSICDPEGQYLPRIPIR